MLYKLLKHLNNKYIQFLLLFVFGINYAFSQQLNDSLYILDAKILTNDSLLPIENAQIISKLNRWGTISDKQGKFKLYVQDFDTILITSMGFRSTIFPIDSSVLLSDSILQITLLRDTISINEVVIHAYLDYKTMKQIIINMQPIDLSQFYPDWEGTGLLYLSPHPMTFKGPIQALYDAFNRSARLQRKLIRNRKEYNKVMYMMGRYLDTIPAMPEHMRQLPH